MSIDISSDYLPIDSSSLRTDTKIGCDLYLLVESSGDRRFILYCRGDVVFENDKKDQLLEKNISKLFIKKEDQQKYFEYLECNFQNIISDTIISPEEKAKIVHSAAINLVKDLFADTRTGTIERTKAYACNMVDYILNDSTAAKNLLKLAAHEYYTYTHSVNVAAVGTLFAQSIGFGENELKSLCSGILLHDVGKTRISTNILNKNGKLTKEELDKIKEHPQLGVKILKESGNNLKDEQIITIQHHENYDGSGYPHGLKKDEIHNSSKVSRIIDVYDALTTDRPYARAVKPLAALAIMRQEMLYCFDKEIFIDFIRFLGPYDPRGKQRKGGILQKLEI
jgi:putative nucleotidyltransferase with HDIG domain